MPRSGARTRRTTPFLDPLQLAWAAGFFDGEGSSYAYECRPGYLRLVVSVGQLGSDDPPEVLWRFKAAMLGLGAIERLDDEGMWCSRSRSTEEGQAAIALLWRELGTVKRHQAARAIDRVHGQYGPDGFKARAPRRRSSADKHVVTQPTEISDGAIDRAWAAGFLDGEGHFGTPRAASRKDGTAWRRIRATASQKGTSDTPPAVLFRMQRSLGGSIERHEDPDDFRWAIGGIQKVEAAFLTVRPWLGTVKQEQAWWAADRYRSQVRLHGDAFRCARGHEYDHVYLARTGPKLRCNACARILSRRKRARSGIAPRRFRDATRRYNE